MKLYRLIAVTEAEENNDGTFTTGEIFSAKYAGGTNQVKVETITLKGKEYKVITDFI